MNIPRLALARYREGGFSLIELAIVVILIALLSAPLLQRYKVFQTQEKIDNTNVSLNAVNNALGDFFITHGRYPCPSDRSIGFGAPNHGAERCAQAESLGNNSCSTRGGLCRAAAATGTDFVVTGGVPYVTLGIPFTETLDGYRLSLSYAVTYAYANPALAKTDGRLGAITLDRVTVSPTNGAESTTAEAGIYYLLRSGGLDGNGAFDINGNMQSPCGTLEDQENCDIDANFRDKPSFDGPGPQHFDDKILAVAWSPASIWAYSDDAPGAIYNTNTGSVGIGTSTPDPAVKLDVAGDIRAQQMRSTQYCDTTGSNCFRTQTIAGTGIACDPGQYLVGIRNNEPVCEAMRTNVQPITCPANQYVVEITNQGVARCGAI